MSCPGSLFGTDCGCGCAKVAGVGAFTDAGEYADIVNAEIDTLDFDVQNAIEGGEIRPGFSFNAWNSFVNDSSWGLHPPQGWRAYYDDLDSIDTVFQEAESNAEIAAFQREYAKFRESFKASGGKTTASDPSHPGVFKTPGELEEEAKSGIDWAFWGLVIGGAAAGGYLLMAAGNVLPKVK